MILLSIDIIHYKKQLIMSIDEYNLIKNKFIRKYPDNEEYDNRINREINLIIKKNFTEYELQYKQQRRKESDFWIAKLTYDPVTGKILTPIWMRDPDWEKKHPGIVEKPRRIMPKNVDHLAELMPLGSTIRLIIENNKYVVCEIPNLYIKYMPDLKILMIECTPRKKTMSLSDYSFSDWF